MLNEGGIVPDEAEGLREVTLYTGDEIYLPIWENDSAALEVQLGCSWHRCKFCDFANDPYHVFSLPEIEAKAQMLQPFAEGKDRLFLLGENPFSQPMDRLEWIFNIRDRWLPGLTKVAMYARFDDVLRKSDAEIGALKERGLVELHMGLESGSQQVLDLMDKGISTLQALRACERLHRIGVDFSFTMMAGAGGRALSADHARESAAFLNASQPKRVWVTGLLVWENTPLARMVEQGQFAPCSFEQRLREMRDMVAAMDMEDCTFVDSTVLGQYTIQGHLPEQKDAIVATMEALLNSQDLNLLS
ncbi:MAG: radical SAM protein [Eggerthellaceae bacterium]|nr:radical SAM protein [Eggerthellaceae bacterium]